MTAPDKEIRHVVALLRACAKQKDLNRGVLLHDDILRHGLTEKCPYISSALVNMYAKCGALAKARQVLDSLATRDVVSWSALITGYVECGQSDEALVCFDRMQQEGHFPDSVAFICILKACASMRAAETGAQVHKEIVRQGLLQNNLRLATAVIDMYVKCGAIQKARQVLNELPVRDVVSWNALMAGYVQQGQGKEALSCFEWMQRDGFSPDAVSLLCASRACAVEGLTDKGKQIHDEAVKQGLVKGNMILGSSLVDMYAKCGALEQARKLLDELPFRNVISWSSLIAGYAQHGQSEEALNCFERMQCEGFSPNEVTFIFILTACASIGAVDKGKRVHDEIARQGLLKKDIVLANALLDMYVKCGALASAKQVLDELPARNTVSWNVLIAGYSQQGQIRDILSFFERMQEEGVSPDGSSLSSVLSACGRTGFLDEAAMYFTRISAIYHIMPDFEHYHCMIDLFGRAGKFNKALAVIQKMPVDYVPVWHALLGACQKWGNVKLARLAFERAVQVEKDDPPSYVSMANIYIAAGMHLEADRVNAMRLRNTAISKAGCSYWIDAMGNVHPFFPGDTEYGQHAHIFDKLQDLAQRMPREGHPSGLHLILQEIHDNAAMDTICGHTGMLAIACALINAPQKATVYVMKNMQVCIHCHDAASCISHIERRKIVIRDSNCVHTFDNGNCTCGNYPYCM